MILADKIVRLRKQNGWSQEELAEKMNVSRQSVSKWESANSIPDLNKILRLGEIFGVSTDFLLKEELVEAESIHEYSEPDIVRISLDQASRYAEQKIAKSKRVSKGVFLCISSVVPLLLLLGLVNGRILDIPTKMGAAAGLVLMFVMVAIAVGLFVTSGQYETECWEIENTEFELVYGAYSIYREKLMNFKGTYHTVTAVCTMIFVLSALPLIVAAFFDSSTLIILMMVVVMILMVAIGVYFMIRVSEEYNAYGRLIGEGNFTPEKKKETKQMEKFGGFYWPLVTAIYIGWSLWTMDWGTTWIVWPVAAIAFVALIGFMGLFERKDKW